MITVVPVVPDRDVVDVVTKLEVVTTVLLGGGCEVAGLEDGGTLAGELVAGTEDAALEDDIS